VQAGEALDAQVLRREALLVELVFGLVVECLPGLVQAVYLDGAQRPAGGAPVVMLDPGVEQAEC
jgi:hypothetical protein